MLSCGWDKGRYWGGGGWEGGAGGTCGICTPGIDPVICKMLRDNMIFGYRIIYVRTNIIKLKSRIDVFYQVAV